MRGQTSSNRARGAALAFIVALDAMTSVAFAPPFWGEAGHRLVGEAAAGAIPAEMPAFFHNAAAQLAYLNPEPDRWRDRAERHDDAALDEDGAPEHFIDLELLTPARAAGLLRAPSRTAFADSLRAMHLSAARVGVLPFAMLEMTQRLRVEFRLWRHAAPADRTWIEQRIVNDAGILGHYAADGSNPAHTSVHHNGWTGPNPNGYTTDDHFHARFETTFVQARVRLGDVEAVATPAPRAFPDVRAAVVAYLQRSNAEIDHLYTLEKERSFDAHNTSPAHVRFAAERLAAGAAMLRDLWWTAWVTSADE